MISHSKEQIGDSTLDQLVEALCDQMEAGELVELVTLVEQYPEMEDRLRVIYPMVQAMASWSGSDTTTGSSLDDHPGISNREIGDFQILRQIGRGGMGVVYEAQQLSINRKVALKILPLATLVDSRALQRFKNEVTAIATLEHPHIVSVYSVGEDRGIHYFAMQLIRGQSLAAVIHELRSRQHKLGSSHGIMINQVVAEMEQNSTKAGSEIDSDSEPIEKENETGKAVKGRPTKTERSSSDQDYFLNVVRVAMQAADALQHAHDHGIVHRDVKPGNLLLDMQGTLFVTDFGLARIETGAGVTMTGDVLGTLRYMSPEQVLGNRVVVDHRTDVYSLGATLYEMLTLRPMWLGDNKAEIIRQISFEEPESPRKINPGIPTDLETIVLKAISKNPSDRFNSAQELSDDLGRFLEKKPIQARRATMSERLTKWALRHRGIVMVALAALMLIAIISSVASVVVWNQSQRRVAAIVELEQAVKEAEDANHLTDAINQFVLKNIIQSAMPSLSGGKHDITVRESLLAADAKIDDSFGGNVRLWTVMKANFGRFLMDIGEYEAARSDLQWGVMGFTVQEGEESQDTVTTMTALAQVYRELGELDSALVNAKEAARLSKLAFEPTDESAIDAIYELAVVLQLSNQFLLAEQTLSEAMAMARAAGDINYQGIITCELGTVSYRQQKFDQAETYWLEALAVADERGDAFNTSVIKQNLANVNGSTGRMAEAVALNKQAYEGFVELAGPLHPLTLKALSVLAVREIQIDDFHSALEHFQMLLDGTTARSGRKHVSSAIAMKGLGESLVGLRRFEEALPLQKEALELEISELGEEDEQVVVTYANLAATYAKVGDVDNAISCYRKSLKGRQAIYAKEPDNFANKLNLGGISCNFANYLSKEKKETEEPIALFTKAIELLENVNQSDPSFHVQLFLANNYLGRSKVLGTLGQREEAFEDADRSILNAPNPSEKDRMRLWKAWLFASQGEVSDAIRITEECLPRITPATSRRFVIASSTIALCAGKSLENDSLGESKARQLFHEQTVRCIQVLTMAEENGYFQSQEEIDELQDDEDFEAVRDTKEFQEFMKRITDALSREEAKKETTSED